MGIAAYIALLRDFFWTWNIFVPYFQAELFV